MVKEIGEWLMANKYSKSNTQKQDIEKSKMKQYEESRERLNAGARIMAILVIISMVVVAFVSAGLYFMG